MCPVESKAPTADANLGIGQATQAPPPLATVLRVSEGLRRVFGSPGYKPPMLPSVALEIHELSCRPDIDTNKLTAVLESDPMLAGHVLRVANSPIFRGRDAETSLRSAVLRLGLKNLGEIVFELALHMRVFRSVEYSGIMEQLRRHSTASANLCRILAKRAGQDPENAFLCGLLHDIGIAAILIVLGERAKSEAALDGKVLEEVVRQTHEEVSRMLVRLWKLPDEVSEVVAHHHSAADLGAAPSLSAVVVIADALAAKFKFSVDFGAGTCDGNDPQLVAIACAKLSLDTDTMVVVEQEAGEVLKRVDDTLKHKAVPVEEDAPKRPADGKKASTAPTQAGSRSTALGSARRSGQGLLARMWRSVLRTFR
jgi:putative nucleotidyltransferase with HDIG domain